jgi:hypothetical protein
MRVEPGQFAPARFKHTWSIQTVVQANAPTRAIIPLCAVLHGFGWTAGMMMSMPDQTSVRYTVTDEAGNEVVDVVPDSLRRFLRDCEGTAVLQRDDRPGQWAAARRDAPGWWVEIGDQSQRLVAHTPNGDATLDVLRAWAEDDQWWAEAFTWKPGHI